MIIDEFVTNEDWQAAPQDDDRAAFFFIAGLARERLKKIYDNSIVSGDPRPYNEARYSFVHDLFAISTTLGIPGLPEPTSSPSEGFYDNFDRSFRTMLAGLRTQYRGAIAGETVTLSYATKASIRDHIESLRDKINRSNLSEKQKAKLHKRVDAVEAELEKKASSIPVILLMVGALNFAGAVSDIGGFVGVVNDISQLVQTEAKKEVEREAEQQPPKLTHQPVKQLEDKRSESEQDNR